MLSKNKNIICVSLNENTFEAALFKKAGSSYRVMNVISENVKGISDDALPKTIHAAIHGFNAKSAAIVCVLPLSLITTKNIEIPSIDENEIKSIVNLQAGRHTPFSREEIEIGYINIGTYKTNYTKVLLVIANKGVVKKQLNALGKAGIKPQHVMFSAEGIGAIYAKSAETKGEGAPVAVVDIGLNSTDFVLVQNGKTLVTRNIPFGKKDIEEDSSAKDVWIEEVKQTVASYKTEDISELPKAYLITTDDAISRSLQESLQAVLGVKVEIDPYVDHVQSTSSVLKKIAVQYPKVSFLNILGPVSGMSKRMIDLFPSEVKLQQSLETQGKEIIKTTILVFILFAIMATFFGLRMVFYSTVLNNLKNDYAPVHKEVTGLKNVSMKTKMVQDFYEKRMLSLDAINALYAIVPDDVYITSLVLDETGTVNLQGVADTASVVFNLGTAFKESSFFDGVEIKSTSSKKDRGKDAAAFEIVLKIKSEEKSAEVAK